MDIQNFGALLAIFTVISQYASLPGTFINHQASFPEQLFGALQITSVIYAGSTVYAHFQHPNGQPSLEPASSLPSSLLPELENVLEKIKGIETNRSAIVFYHPPETVTSVIPWAEPTSGPKPGSPRMPVRNQIPPITSGITMSEAILTILEDTPWAFWFLVSILVVISLTRTNKRDTDGSNRSRPRNYCSDTLDPEGLTKKLNAIEGATGKTNEHLTVLHVDFTTLIEQARELNVAFKGSQNTRDTQSNGTSARFASIENEMQSIKRSLDSRSEGRDYQIEIGELQTGKLDTAEASERFSSISSEIRALKQSLYTKVDETEHQEVAKDSRKIASHLNQLSELMNNEISNLRSSINSKATLADYESVIEDLKRNKVDRRDVENEFNTLDKEITAMKDSMDWKRTPMDIESLRKEMPQYVQQSVDRLDKEIGNFRQALDSKTSATDRQALSTELEALKTALDDISGDLTSPQQDNRPPLSPSASQPRYDHRLQDEIENLKKELQDQRTRLDSYQGTGSQAKHSGGTGNPRNVVTDELFEDPVSEGILERLDAIEASLASNVDSGRTDDTPRATSQTTTSNHALREQQKIGQGLENISELKEELSEVEKPNTSSHLQGTGVSTPIPSYIPSEADFKEMQGNLKEVQQNILDYSSQLNELRNSRGPESKLSGELEGLKGTLSTVSGRVGEVEKLGAEWPELKRKLEEVKQASPSSEERVNQSEFKLFKAEVTEKITDLKEKIADKKSPSIPSQVQSSLDAISTRLDSAAENYHKTLAAVDKEFSGMKERVDNLSEAKSETKSELDAISAEIQQLKEYQEGSKGTAKTSEAVSPSAIARMVKDNIRDNEQMKGLRTRIDLIEKGPETLTGDGKVKRSHLGLFSKLQEVERSVYDHSGDIYKASTKANQAYGLGSGAWDKSQICQFAIKEIVGDMRTELPSLERRKEIENSVPRLTKIENRLLANEKTLEEWHGAVKSMTGTDGTLPGLVYGSSEVKNGSSEGGSGQNPPPPGPAGGSSGVNDDSGRDGQRSEPSPPGPVEGSPRVNNGSGDNSKNNTVLPDPSNDESVESEASEASEEDRPVVSAPTLGKYAVVQPSELKTSSKTEAASPSTPTITSGALANVSVFDPKHPSNQDNQGKEQNPFAKLNTPDSSHSNTEEDKGKGKAPQADEGVLDPSQENKDEEKEGDQSSDKGKDLYIKNVSIHDPSHPRNQGGQFSDKETYPYIKNVSIHDPSHPRNQGGQSSDKGKDPYIKNISIHDPSHPRNQGQSSEKDTDKKRNTRDTEDELGSPPRKQSKNTE